MFALLEGVCEPGGGGQRVASVASPQLLGRCCAAAAWGSNRGGTGGSALTPQFLPEEPISPPRSKQEHPWGGFPSRAPPLCSWRVTQLRRLPSVRCLCEIRSLPRRRAPRRLPLPRQRGARGAGARPGPVPIVRRQQGVCVCSQASKCAGRSARQTRRPGPGGASRSQAGFGGAPTASPPWASLLGGSPG